MGELEVSGRHLPFFGNTDFPFNSLVSIKVVVEDSFVLILFRGNRNVLLDQVFVKQESIGDFQETTHGPDYGEDNVFLVFLIGGIFVLVYVDLEHTSEQVEELSHPDDIGNVHHVKFNGPLESFEESHISDVFGEEGGKFLEFFSSVKVGLSGLDPRFDNGFVSQVSGRNINDSASRDGSGRSVVEVFDFEHQLAVFSHGDSFSVSESKNLVVIEHSIEIFNPNSIYRSIANNPSVEFVGSLIGLLPQSGENTRGPVIGDFGFDSV